MSALLVPGSQAALPGHPSVQKRRQCFELIAVHENEAATRLPVTLTCLIDTMGKCTANVSVSQI